MQDCAALLANLWNLEKSVERIWFDVAARSYIRWREALWECETVHVVDSKQYDALDQSRICMKSASGKENPH